MKTTHILLGAGAVIAGYFAWQHFAHPGKAPVKQVAGSPSSSALAGQLFDAASKLFDTLGGKPAPTNQGPPGAQGLAPNEWSARNEVDLTKSSFGVRVPGYSSLSMSA